MVVKEINERDFLNVLHNYWKIVRLDKAQIINSMFKASYAKNS